MPPSPAKPHLLRVNAEPCITALEVARGLHQQRSRCRPPLFEQQHQNRQLVSLEGSAPHLRYHPYLLCPAVGPGNALQTLSSIGLICNDCNLAKPFPYDWPPAAYPQTPLPALYVALTSDTGSCRTCPWAGCGATQMTCSRCTLIADRPCGTSCRPSCRSVFMRTSLSASFRRCPRPSASYLVTSQSTKRFSFYTTEGCGRPAYEDVN